jgi:TonB-linked SusC/RagA family outer membrane protein
MKKRLLFILGILLAIGHLFAQTRAVTGKVTDEAGAGLAGATVLAGRVSTTTNAAGDFTLNIPSGVRQLQASFVGFETQNIAVTSQSTYSIKLTTANTSLSDVVVTGYTRERKSQFAGAATIIGSKAVETVPVGSFDQALQGRAPGLLVNSGSGQPGSSPTVTIRGVQSIQGAGAQPLYILDGVPISAGDFQTINGNDFESITVLKDANAAALYGARGGTGVIVITTKKGRAGATKFSVRSQVGVTLPPDFSRLNLMNSAEILEYEERMGVQGASTATPGWTYSKKNPTYATASAAEQARRDRMLDSLRGINTDLRDVLFRQGISQTHEMNMSGGSDKTRFYISGSMFDQQGIDLKSALRRYTTRFNIEHTTGRLTLALNSTVGFSKTIFAEGDWQGNSPSNPFQMIYRAKPYENPFNLNGSLNYGTSTNLALKQVANLLEGVENTNWNQNQIKINSGLSLSYKILESLTLKNTIGVDVSSDVNQRFVNPNSYRGSLQTNQSGVDIEAYRRTSQIINTTSLLYANKFQDVHEIEAGAYFETVRGYQKALGFTLYNLDPRLPGTGQGAGTLPTNGATTYPQNATSASSGFGIRSYFATARYTYNNKYSVNGNIRRDGTSRIANEANREITTWSAGLIWNAMQEEFMKNQNILSDFRVRATYGIVPNIGSISTGAYGITGLTSVTNYLGPQVPSFGTGSYAGSPVTGLVPTTPGNPNLKIEKIQKLNLGADFAVWKNRARFTVDVYKNKTVDLFVNNPLSGTTGFSSLYINAGVMTNKGIEFTANVDVVRTQDFHLTLGLNHSYNKNNIEDLGSVNEFFLGTFVIRKGLPYGSHYTYNYFGADPATGAPRYETADGKETNDIAKAGQFAKFGSYIPKHQGGFTADISYKGFSISALFSYQFDVIRSNNTRNWITRGTPGYQASVNGSRELLTKQWQKPGDVALFQGVLYDRNFTSSDLEDAKFLRFRNLNIAYQIPQIRVGGTTVLKSARIYVQAQNLAVWSPWHGVDPEDNNNISLNEYPNPKMYVAGIDINF